MINIRPVSDLRNKFNEIESQVKTGEPVYLTKNGYCKMVIMSIEEYSRLTNLVEEKLDEADVLAETSTIRLTHNEVFEDISC